MTNWAALNTPGAPSSDESNRDPKEEQPRERECEREREREGEREREREREGEMWGRESHDNI